MVTFCAPPAYLIGIVVSEDLGESQNEGPSENTRYVQRYHQI